MWACTKCEGEKGPFNFIKYTAKCKKCGNKFKLIDFVEAESSAASLSMWGLLKQLQIYELSFVSPEILKAIEQGTASKAQLTNFIENSLKMQNIMMSMTQNKFFGNN